MIDIKHILFPTDFSEPAQHAMRFAVSFAQEYGAKLTILHVVEDMANAIHFDLLQAPPLAQLLTESEERARAELAELMPTALSPPVESECLLRHGIPFVEIVRAAAEFKSDLIVLGTHGRTGLTHALFGSVAEKVVRKAPCPVLTVRHPEHKFEMP